MNNDSGRVLSGNITDQPATFPGAEPGTALRVRHEGDGQVHLEHLAYSTGLGWYVQKSFTIPAELLSVLIPELRKANCLAPRTPAAGQESYRLFGPESHRLRLASNS